jgi:WD40 repeat protein
MSEIKQVQHVLPNKEFICFVIPKLFSKNECTELLSPEIKNAFQKAISNYPTYYRNNDRLVIDSQQLADFLFEKVKPYLPEQIEMDYSGNNENGKWKLNELNNRFRYCRYSANQYFNRHLDGIHFRSETTQSKLTFMLYLNSAAEFEGGRTLFFKNKNTTEIWASYTPQQGDLIVFDHNIWHSGEELLSGEKYVLRSDILYDRENSGGNPPYAKPYESGHLGYVWKLLFFDHQTLLSAGRDKEIKIWDKKGRVAGKLSGHENSILCMEKINESIFISGSRDKHIKVWTKKDTGKFDLKTDFVPHSAVILSLTRLSDTTFASSSGDSSIKISDVEGNELHTLLEHSNWVWQVLRLNENVLASCSEDQTIKIWNYKNGKSITTFSEAEPVFCLAYNENSGCLASGNLNGEIIFKKLSPNFDSGEIIKKIKAHNGIIRTLLFIGDHFMASGGEDNKVKIIEIKTSDCIAEFQHSNFVQSIVLSDKNKLLSASYDGTIQTWDLPLACQK